MPRDLSPDGSGQLTVTELALFEIGLALAERWDVARTSDAMLGVMERLFDARATWMLLHHAATNELVTAALRGPGADAYANVRVPCDRGIVGLVFHRREAVFVADTRHEHRWFDPERVQRSALRSVLTIPLVLGSHAIGVLGLDSRRFTAANPPNRSDTSRLLAIAAIAAAAITNARRCAEVEGDRSRLERLVCEQRVPHSDVRDSGKRLRHCHSIDAVIGQSPPFRDVLDQVQLVAPADSTVLLVGETGTGKEVIARALHDQSRRSCKPFIAVNCAALPETLVESELFGYEKGAFTGALSRKPGQFELANLGTLFLDEIGDLPAQAQAKLLRVLQEREVQRVGGTRPECVNVRLIAATNQDLAGGVESGRFRADLFYRLNVFPIRLPPLRERPDDIAPLAQHFIRRFAERQHKPLPRLAGDALDRLVSYSWPGNVRELQNVIERAVILCLDSVIGVDLIVLQSPLAPTRHLPASPVQDGVEHRRPNVIRFCDAERHAIQRALKLSGWRISGRAGAADVLGLKPTTLHAKMKRLGIRRPSAQSSDGKCSSAQPA